MPKRRRANRVRPNRFIGFVGSALSGGPIREESNLIRPGLPVEQGLVPVDEVMPPPSDPDSDEVLLEEATLPVEQDLVPVDEVMHPPSDSDSDEALLEEATEIPPWFKDQLTSDDNAQEYPCLASDDLFPFPSKTVGELYFWLESGDNGLSRKSRRSLLKMLQSPDFDPKELAGYSLENLESFRCLFPQQKPEKITCSQRLVFHQKRNEVTGEASVRTVRKNISLDYYSLVEKVNYALHDPVHHKYSDQGGPRLPSGIGVREFNESNFARNANLLAGETPLSLLLREEMYYVGDTVEIELSDGRRVYRIEKLFHRAAQNHEIEMWATLR